jgi:hypothetical protein
VEKCIQADELSSVRIPRWLALTTLDDVMLLVERSVAELDEQNRSALRQKVPPVVDACPILDAFWERECL